MALLTGYLLLPIDLVPDFIPLVGYADDAVIVLWALRSITKSAGVSALDRHWPGSADGLKALKLIAGVEGRSARSGRVPRSRPISGCANLE